MGDHEPGQAATRSDLADEPEFDLGGVRVCPAERAIVMEGERRELQPRVMRVLVALARLRPAVVSRDRLVEQCWDGRVVGDDALNRCILALRHLAQEFTPQPFTIETVPRIGYRLAEHQIEAGVRTSGVRGRGWKLAIAAALAVLLAAAILIYRSGLWPLATSAQPPTVLVAAAANDGTSQMLARDLSAKLGSLEAIHSASVRLISEAEGPSAKPDLIVKVGRIADPGTVGATVVLTGGPGRAILWSKEFEQPSRNVADLKQQIAYTAARVLGCAVEGMGSKDRLSEQGLKTYLNACAALSDFGNDVRQIVLMLEGVVRTSPGFVGGWAKLLHAEMDAVDNPVFPEGAALRPALKRHIVSARKIEPDLAEAYLAEYMLTPPADFLARSRILDTAVARHPDHAAARAFRASFFASVGRMDEAVRDARQAVRLDPLSPSLRDGYVAALAYAGHVDAALDELSETERLWPGASSVLMARYRVHLRYGDPKEALRLIRSRAVDTPAAIFQEAFLNARMDPSPENVEKAIQQVRSAHRDWPQVSDNYSQTLAEFDRKEELLDILLNWRRMDVVDRITDVVFRPAFSELHRDPRFMKVANHLGLLRYWRTTGHWPDFCFAPDLPYDCKAEASKIAPDQGALGG